MIRVDPLTGIVERMVERDGKLIVNRSQDVRSVIEQNKIEADTAPSAHGDAKFRKVGSIPFVVAEQWSAECGAAIGTQEFAIYCKRKLMDGDFAAFRVRGV